MNSADRPLQKQRGSAPRGPAGPSARHSVHREAPPWDPDAREWPSVSTRGGDRHVAEVTPPVCAPFPGSFAFVQTLPPHTPVSYRRRTDFLGLGDLRFHRGRRCLGFPFPLRCLFRGASCRGPEAQHFLEVLKCRLSGGCIGHQPGHFSQVFGSYPNGMSSVVLRLLICLLLSVCSETGSLSEPA